MRRGVRALGAAALLAALATAMAAALAVQAWAETDGASKVSAAPGPASGTGAHGPASPVLRLSFSQLRLRNSGHPVPVVFAAPRRLGIFLISLAWPDPRVYGPSAAWSAGMPDARFLPRNRTAELRSRTVLKWNFSSRVDFVGLAQGSRLRMLRITLAMFGSGTRMIRRAFGPGLRVPGLSLSLKGISVQAGIRVRLF